MDGPPTPGSGLAAAGEVALLLAARASPTSRIPIIAGALIILSHNKEENNNTHNPYVMTPAIFISISIIIIISIILSLILGVFILPSGHLCFFCYSDNVADR